MRTLSTLILALLSLAVIGQQGADIHPLVNNSVYFEVFGQGLINSINYERTFNTDRRIINSATVGITLLPTKRETVYGIPVSFNWITGKKCNHLEFGFGCSYEVDNNKDIHATEGTYQYNPVTGTYDIGEEHSFIGSQAQRIFYITPRIGYRYQKPEGGLQFRISLIPAIALVSKLEELKGSQLDQGGDPPVYLSWKDLWLNSPVMPWAGISIGYSF